jgi:DNA invertase Pin-like site-specific DNA recombinase
MATGKFISYLRVSTDKQGRSGLGLDAQRQAVSDFLNGGCWSLLKEYVEVETGKHDQRPALIEALHHCKVTGATLVIAKLDRLSRDLEFIARLQKSGTRFLCTDMPEATELSIHLFAAIAQHERKTTSERTKAALGSIKRTIEEQGSYTSRTRGTTISRLGNPHGAEALRRAGKGNTAAIEAVHKAADQHARDILSVINDIRRAGIVSFKGIARELNAREIRTARGGAWHPSTVRNLLARGEWRRLASRQRTNPPTAGFFAPLGHSRSAACASRTRLTTLSEKEVPSAARCARRGYRGRAAFVGPASRR